MARLKKFSAVNRREFMKRAAGAGTGRGGIRRTGEVAGAQRPRQQPAAPAPRTSRC